MAGFIQRYLSETIYDRIIIDEFVTAGIMVVLGCWDIPKGKRYVKEQFGYETVKSYLPLFASMLDTGKLVSSYKLAALRYVIHDDDQYLRKFGFGRDTRRELNRRRSMIIRELRGRIALPISERDRTLLLDRIIKTMLKEMERFVGKKLKFIWKYDAGNPHDHIVNDMMYKIVWMFWRCWPFYPEAHLFNMCRRTVSNEAKHMQRKFGGDSDNARVVRTDDDTFTLTQTSLNDNLMETNHIHPEQYIFVNELKRIIFEKADRLESKAMRLMLMEDDEDFLRFVNRSNLPDFCDEVGISEYDRQIASYLRQPESWVAINRERLKNLAISLLHSKVDSRQSTITTRE